MYMWQIIPQKYLSSYSLYVNLQNTKRASAEEGFVLFRYAIVWHGDMWCQKVTELKVGLLTFQE